MRRGRFEGVAGAFKHNFTYHCGIFSISKESGDKKKRSLLWKTSESMFSMRFAPCSHRKIFTQQWKELLETVFSMVSAPRANKGTSGPLPSNVTEDTSVCVTVICEVGLEV